MTRSPAVDMSAVRIPEPSGFLRRPANREFFKMKGVPKAIRRLLQYVDGFCRHFRPDSIAGQNDDPGVHHSPPRVSDLCRDVKSATSREKR